MDRSEISTRPGQNDKLRYHRHIVRRTYLVNLSPFFAFPLLLLLLLLIGGGCGGLSSRPRSSWRPSRPRRIRRRRCPRDRCHCRPAAPAPAPASSGRRSNPGTKIPQVAPSGQKTVARLDFGQKKLHPWKIASSSYCCNPLVAMGAVEEAIFFATSWSHRKSKVATFLPKI